MSGPAVDVERVIAELRGLDARTGGAGGARRVAWGPVWQEAREWLRGLLDELGLETERDAAGNLRARLRGESSPGLALGSHLDSVPSGGWLDGCLGVFAALGVVRAWVGSGRRPPRDLVLVDWADEEGARFGHSLLGSSAFAGALDLESVAALRDREGTPIREALAGSGVELERMLDAGEWRGEIDSYLELHIEQGPVLESESLPVAAVDACVGIERRRFEFAGRAGHAGTTPMDVRSDAALAAAEAMLAVEVVARDRGGMGTTGELTLAPGIVTAVAGEAALGVDLRHRDAGELALMHSEAARAAAAVGRSRGVEVRDDPLWRIDPTSFEPALVAAARESCRDAAGTDRVLTSGALHDAAIVARVVPAAMVFVASKGGISHSLEEDSSDADLRAGIEAFAACANRLLEA